MVLLALEFLTPMFFYIPDAALAAVIIMAVTDMINFSMVKHLWIINSTLLLSSSRRLWAHDQRVKDSTLTRCTVNCGLSQRKCILYSATSRIPQLQRRCS